LSAHVRRAVPGAIWETDDVVAGLEPAASIRAAVRRAVLALGREFVDEPPPLPFATDFGNVSHAVPAALIGIGRPGGWAFHTDEGAAQFAADLADPTTSHESEVP